MNVKPFVISNFENLLWVVALIPDLLEYFFEDDRFFSGMYLGDPGDVCNLDCLEVWTSLMSQISLLVSSSILCRTSKFVMLYVMLVRFLRASLACLWCCSRVLLDAEIQIRSITWNYLVIAHSFTITLKTEQTWRSTN